MDSIAELEDFIINFLNGFGIVSLMKRKERKKKRKKKKEKKKKREEKKKKEKKKVKSEETVKQQIHFSSLHLHLLSFLFFCLVVFKSIILRWAILA